MNARLANKFDYLLQTDAVREVMPAFVEPRAAHITLRLSN